MYDIWDVWSENTCQGHVQTNYTDWKTCRKEFRTTMLMCKPVLFEFIIENIQIFGICT